MADRTPLRHRITDERGVALPMALLALVLLSSLAIAFVILSTSEPRIANNHLRAAQARSLAESGLEQALWAIVNTTAAGGLSTLPSPVPGVAASPFDGGLFQRVSAIGGFTVSIEVTAATGPVADAATIVAAGRTTLTAASETPTSRSVARAQYVRFPDVGISAPCALCLSGNIELTGSTDMAGGGSGTPCGNKYGVWSTGTLTQSGSAAINGNRPATSATDYLQSQPQSTFDSFALTESAIAALRGLAKTIGRHYKPASNGGTVNFSGMPASGLIFVDTYAECSAIDSTSCQATVADIGPGSFAGSGDFTGWLIVMGNINTHGNFGGITGFVYVDGDADMGGMGTSGISGILMVRRRLGTTDPKIAGNANVTFDCDAVRNSTPIEPGWAMIKGSYCDNPGGC
jgi:hypothetical protein